MPIKKKIIIRRRVRPGRKRPAPFRKLRRAIYGRIPRMNNKFNVKRITCGRLMTLYSTAASAGSSTTWNSNGFLSLTSGAGIAGQPTYHSISCAFCLDDIPAITDFTNMFDLYRINCVVMRIYPISTESSTSGGGYSNIGGFIHHITDDNDYAALTASDIGIDEIRQYQNYRVNNISSRRPIRRKIYPKITMAGAASGAFTVAVNAKPRFINTSYNNATHYAFKAVFEMFQPANTISVHNFKIEPIYYMTFKNVR